ncbi:MAG: D-alanyl-D-alanine carboxypeptidase family protein [bacterium]
MRRLILLLTLVGCADAPLERTEARPDDPGETLKAGVVSCAPWLETGYEAGEPFPITVVQVDGKPVERTTANAFAVMQMAARAEGVYLQVISGFRSHQEQAWLYQCYVDCACNQCNLAAPPGYSNHQSGYALDLNTQDPGVYAWLSRHGADFGFARTVPSEDWHWEYMGGGPGGGPCAGDGTARPAPVAFVGFRSGTTWRNGQWLKVEVKDPAVHHVRYEVDGYAVGVSEDAETGFAVRLVLHELGLRTLRARAFDAQDLALGEDVAEVKFVAGERPGFSMQFDDLRDGGWYRNGMNLRVDAPPPGTKTVEFSAGRYRLGEANPGESLRMVFGTLGYRALLARALGDEGKELARTTILVRVLPGEDAGVEPSVAFLAPAAGGSYQGELELQVLGSDRVVAVSLSADGYALGEATRSGRTWVLRRGFSQLGERTFRAEGRDASGAVVATAEVKASLR